MDYNSTYEQEIDLKDLMFVVLRKWKMILAVAVVLALLFGGVKAGMTYKKQNDPEQIEQGEKEYQDALDIYEKNKATCEREIENLKTDITKQTEYLEKSILINMSPYDVSEARMDLYVSTDYEIMPGMVYQNVDYTDTILQAYQAMLTSSAVKEDIAKKVGTESRYLNELVSVSVGTNSGKLNHLLTISAKNSSKQEAQKIMNEIKAHLSEMQQQITISIGEHQINTVNDSLTTLVDLSLADKQKSENQRLTTLNESLETKQKELNDLEEPKAVTSSAKAAVKDGVKYALIGGILGGFMIAFFAAMAFIMSDKVYSAKELKNRYKVKILGILPVKNRKPAGAVNAWLNRLEGRVEPGREEESYALITANIRNYSEKLGKILVAGCAEAEAVQDIADRLKRDLKEIEVISGKDMLQDAETLKQLPLCDGVVLVEQCGMTKYSMVEQEVEKIIDIHKTVVGCIVFE